MHTCGKSKQDYLVSLPPWDGRCRIETMLIDYLGARDSEYVRGVSRNMMVSAIARSLYVNCGDASIPLLIGPPGCGKGTFIQRLASGYFGVITSTSQYPVRTLAAYIIVQVYDCGDDTIDQLNRPVPFLPIVTATEKNLSDNLQGQFFSPVHVGIHDVGRAFTVERDEIDQLWAEAVAAYHDGERPYVGFHDACGRRAEEAPISKKYPYGVL